MAVRGEVHEQVVEVPQVQVQEIIQEIPEVQIVERLGQTPFSLDFFQASRS